MHAAPPVRMSLAPDAAWRTFATACAGAAAGNLAAWIGSQANRPAAEVAVLALLAAALAAALAWCSLRRGNAGRGILSWDGAAWQWAPGQAQPGDSQPSPGELRVMVDLGGWILLRFVPGASAQRVNWMVASRRQGGAQWPLWRAALFSRRPSAASTAAADPS